MTLIITVYADMEGGDCNNLDFQLGGTGIDATIPTRSWSIKVDFYLSLFILVLIINYDDAIIYVLYNFLIYYR